MALATWRGVAWHSSGVASVTDYGVEVADAVMLLGQVAEARCTQVVNPKYTYIAKIPKRYLG